MYDISEKSHSSSFQVMVRIGELFMRMSHHYAYDELWYSKNQIYIYFNYMCKEKLKYDLI